MIKFRCSGNLSKSSTFLKRMTRQDFLSCLDKYGKEGCDALAAATPRRTGKTAASWIYEIHRSEGSVKIIWSNTNVVNGVSVAILLQYGHGTKHGGYVQGRDYINPAIRPIFDKIAETAFREVSNS